jgi:metal-responsive CopG/Arc/MetJ family transcriptional regulator
MPNNTVKIAISLPKQDYQLLEKIRQRLGISRSAMIDKALYFWLKRRQEEELIKKYEDSYRKKPENVSEIIGWEKAGMEAVEKGGWR